MLIRMAMYYEMLHNVRITGKRFLTPSIALARRETWGRDCKNAPISPIVLSRSLLDHDTSSQH